MTASVSGLLSDRLPALHERKRALDASWLLILVAVLLATGAPWYLRVLDIEMGVVAWSLFGYSLVYLGVAYASDLIRSHRLVLAVMIGLQMAGVTFLGWVWHLVGSVQNPLFLLTFVLPVVAAGLLTLRWHAYSVALLSIVVALFVAVVDSPGLRWYLSQFAAIEPALSLLPVELAGRQEPFPAAVSQPGYLVVSMVFFSLLIFTVALTSESISSLLLRLYERLHLSSHALEEEERLSQAVLRAAPEPSVLAFRDTLMIAQASDSFTKSLLLEPEDLSSKSFFDLVHFSYRDVVERLLENGEGEMPFAVYRVGPETRVARVHCFPLSHRGTEYLYITMHDVSALYYLKSALDAAPEPHLLIGSDRRLVYFNRRAAELFKDPCFGAPAAEFLEREGTPSGWWHLGVQSRSRRRIALGERQWGVDLTAATIPGEREKLTILVLREIGT